MSPDELTDLVQGLGASQTPNPPGNNQGRTIPKKKTPHLSAIAKKTQAKGKETHQKPAVAQEPPKKSKADMLKEALEAQLAGDSVKVRLLLESLAKQPIEQQASAAGRSSTKRAIELSVANKDFKEGGVTFFVEGVNTFKGMGLPPFFNHNMKELKGKHPPFSKRQETQSRSPEPDS
ncbi:hypothetical protein PtA15_4A224 [Puccinia triticina]|uniref:Uncharacterized protein n=1 Tax=Puccinia triticina TaxID=208348 RepID=A0ABY7CG95_9BASI|nr:uncharacterized protein PtA15_4A224 [Puccinia triticina]WAQ83775.1 hypothetical protein PtA15_4A224 [Puccinia triticina]WAR54617.1 hypothetical protein PtB15_4B234 [Puccinia triticina]